MMLSSPTLPFIYHYLSWRFSAALLIWFGVTSSFILQMMY